MDEAFRRIASGTVGDVYLFECCGVAHSHSPVEYNDTASITFTRGGSFTYSNGTRSHEIHHATVLLENPGVEYRIRHGVQTGEICTTVVLKDSWGREWADRLRTGRQGVSWTSPTGRGEQPLFPWTTFPMRPGLALIHRILEKGPQAWDPSLAPLGTDQLLVRLLDGVFESFEGSARAGPHHNEPATDPHRETVWLAKRFITEHFRESLSIEDLAGAAGVSPFYFTRLFRGVTGKTPYRYLLDTRLAYACLLLADTDRSSTQIAFDSGFGSISHFTDSFTRFAGTPPQRYRRRILGRGR